MVFAGITDRIVTVRPHFFFTLVTGPRRSLSFTLAVKSHRPVPTSSIRSLQVLEGP